MLAALHAQKCLVHTQHVLLHCLDLHSPRLIPLSPDFSEVHGDDADGHGQDKDAGNHGARGHNLPEERHRHHISIAHCREGDDAPPERVWNTDEGGSLVLSVVAHAHVASAFTVPTARLHIVHRSRGEADAQNQVDPKHVEHLRGPAKDADNDLKHLEVLAQLHKSEEPGEPQHSQHREVGDCHAQELLHVERQNHEDVYDIHWLRHEVQCPHQRLWHAHRFLVCDDVQDPLIVQQLTPCEGSRDGTNDVLAREDGYARALEHIEDPVLLRLTIVAVGVPETWHRAQNEQDAGDKY
mmetsp:Transcript_66304/g.153999  ORF Transcript_66304/g.153999 Transcript_66304/m.153999 type:complete len:296 (+) Transcript_66304:1086-1973(+)